MKKKVQIIGKVTGLNLEVAKEKFAASQAQLERSGYEVYNPMVMVPHDSSYADAMRICLRKLTEVDMVAIQPDWYMSDGAKVEYTVAVSLDLPIVRI